jgi:magnesium-transporting ATPase (P-type)
MISMIKDLPSNYDDIYLHYAREGSRVLCLGYKELGNLSHQELRDLTRDDVESSLHFAGFIIISCPLKPDTKSVIREIMNASHHITMITGDNPLTACHVASQLKLIDKRNSIVLSKNESNHNNEWQWTSVMNEKLTKPLKYAVEQKGYLKAKLLKRKEADALSSQQIEENWNDKTYKSLCLTGEVNKFRLKKVISSCLTIVFLKGIRLSLQ